MNIAIRRAVLELVDDERVRQHSKFGHEPLATDTEFVAILGEEFGEICRAICQGNDLAAREEATQCIAVILAWLENDIHFGKAK